MHLGADLTRLDARHERMVFEGSDLSDEEMGSHVLSVEDQTRLHRRVGGHDAQGTDPPLGRGDEGRVEVERLRRVVVRRDGLELLHVGAVTQLRLSVAAEDLVVETLGHPVGLLLVRSLRRDDGLERDLVEIQPHSLVHLRQRLEELQHPSAPGDGCAN